MNPLFRSTRAYRRFVHAHETFEARYDKSAAWAPDAERILKTIKTRIGERDLEGAWDCLHQAHRLELLGLRGQKLANEQRKLRSEVTKIDSPWRQRAIEELLGQAGISEEAQAINLEAAQDLMHDYFQTRYYKNGLLRDQLRNIVLIAFTALAALLALVGLAADDPDLWPVWNWKAVLMVLLYGVLGASFSATRKITSDAGRSAIPERVAQGWITVARIVLGAVPALAAYAFLRAGILNIGDGNFGSVLVASFAAGFSERFVMNLLQSVNGSRGDAEKPPEPTAKPPEKDAPAATAAAPQGGGEQRHGDLVGRSAGGV